jgi:transaldolase
LERRAAAGKPLAAVAAVAGFGISPVDDEVDRRLRGLHRAAPDAAHRRTFEALLGQAAIANAQGAYRHFRQQFSGARFAALRAGGARVQPLLWSGLEVQNRAFHDLRYVEALIGPDTIAAFSLPILEAFEDHGRARRMTERHLDEAEATLRALAGAGITLPEVADHLLAKSLRATDDPARRLAAPLSPAAVFASFG